MKEDQIELAADGIPTVRDITEPNATRQALVSPSGGSSLGGNEAVVPPRLMDATERALAKIRQHEAARGKLKSPHHRTRSKLDLGITVRSGWEAKYAYYLTWLKGRGEIADWQYEPHTFRFATVLRGPFTYTPDFRVEYLDGAVVWVEVKGYLDTRSKTQLKRMHKFFPHAIVRVMGRDWFADMERNGLAGVIPGWK